MRDIILIGGGGHCKACIDVIESLGTHRVAGIVDVKQKLGQEILGYKVIATDEDIVELAKKYRTFLITLGQVQTGEKRKRLFAMLESLGAELPVLASPRACVSKHASIGRGTIIMHLALVNAGAVVGRNCIVNSGAGVEHDAVVGDHCHIATGARVNGGCRISDGCFVGSGAVVSHDLAIAPGCVIGAGSAVIKSIIEPGVYAGCPARRIR